MSDNHGEESLRGMETDRQRDRGTRRIMCSTESTGECGGGGQISLANREHIPALETDLIMAYDIVF